MKKEIISKANPFYKNKQSNIPSAIFFLILSLSVVAGAIGINSRINETNSPPIFGISSIENISLGFNKSAELNQTINNSIINTSLFTNLTENISVELNETSNNTMINDSVNLIENVSIDINETVANNILAVNETDLTNENEQILNETTNLTSLIVENLSLGILIQEKIGLAKLFNQDSMQFDKEYAEKYLSLFQNFSNIEYKGVVKDTATIMTVGAKQDNIKGFDVKGDKFSVHLIYCDRNSKSCAFRINGVPTGKLHIKNTQDKQNEFQLNKDYVLKINSIKFDYCDNRRFCNVAYEAYDVVDMEIERKVP